MISRRAAIGAGLLAATAGGASAQAAARRSVLTAVDAHRAGYPTVAAVGWMGEEMARETGGRISFRQYPAGQLGSETDTVNLTRFGVLDICRVNIAALNNAFPLTQPLAMPYVFRDVGHMRRVLDGDIGRDILASFSHRNLVGLAFYDAGVRSMYNARHPITTPADMHGLKVRVQRSDIFLAIINAMGANATPIAFSEVYTGLQTHLIDGAENNFSTIESQRHYEVARFHSNTAHSMSPEALIISKDRFDAMAPADRDLLVAKARESVAIMRTIWDENEATSRQTVLDAGMQFNEVDLEAFERVAAPVRQRFTRDNAVASVLQRIVSHA